MKKIFIILLLSILAEPSFPQNDFNTKGYLQTLETVWIKDFSESWLTMNSINNRFDFRWYPSNSISTHLGIQNNFTYGQLLQTVSEYATLVSVDEGYLDLTKKISSDTSYVLYSKIDRANLQYSLGDFEVIIGRQRINWGINLVWNPNDIFNTFSYFDFDYEEKPGSDAIKLEYYTGMTSSVQLACKVNKAKKITLAGMYRFNKWNYDFQTFGGIMEDDIVFGAGWSGDISTAGFNGEITYFIPKNNINKSSEIVAASIGANYTFSNSLIVHSSILYNSNGTTGKAGLEDIFINQNISAKSLSRARYSLFGRLSYPLTPLINTDLSAIINPSDKSFYIGPSVDISLVENLYLLIIAQLFGGENGTEFGDYGKLFYLRLKWNF